MAMATMAMAAKANSMVSNPLGKPTAAAGAGAAVGTGVTAAEGVVVGTGDGTTMDELVDVGRGVVVGGGSVVDGCGDG